MGWKTELGHITKMAAMPIYGKIPLKFFSKTSRPITFALGQRWGPYKICSNDDPRLTLTYFTARSTLLPNAFEWENALILVFMETTEIFGEVVQVSTWIHMSTRGQDHCLIFVKGHSGLYFKHLLQSCWIDQSKFMIRGQNLFKWCRSHDARWPPCPYIVKFFKNKNLEPNGENGGPWTLDDLQFFLQKDQICLSKDNQGKRLGNKISSGLGVSWTLQDRWFFWFFFLFQAVT